MACVSPEGVIPELHLPEANLNAGCNVNDLAWD